MGYFFFHSILLDKHPARTERTGRDVTVGGELRPQLSCAQQRGVGQAAERHHSSRPDFSEKPPRQPGLGVPSPQREPRGPRRSGRPSFCRRTSSIEASSSCLLVRPSCRRLRDTTPDGHTIAPAEPPGWGRSPVVGWTLLQTHSSPGRAPRFLQSWSLGPMPVMWCVTEAAAQSSTDAVTEDTPFLSAARCIKKLLEVISRLCTGVGSERLRNFYFLCHVFLLPFL